MLGRAAQAEEAQLADFHAGVEQDRQRCNIAQFQSDVAAEAWVNESCGGVCEESKSTEAALTLKSASDIIGQANDFEGAREHELTRVQHKRVVGVNFDKACEVGLLNGWVNVRIAMVLEGSEETVESYINAGWLNHPRVVGLKTHSARIDFSTDIAVAQQHMATLSGRSGSIGQTRTTGFLTQSTVLAGVVQWQNFSFPS